MLDLLDIFQSANALADGGEIRQGAAEPALINVELAASQRRFLDRFLRLFFAPYKQDLPTAAHNLLKKLRRTLELSHCFVQINDINLIALLKDERLHLRVPTLGLVSEMDTRLEKFRH